MYFCTENCIILSTGLTKNDSDHVASTNDFGKDKHQIQLYFCEIRTRSIFLGPAETVTGSVRWPAGGRVSDWLTSHRGLRTRVWTTAKRQIVTRLCVADHWLFITLFRRPRHKRLLNEPVHAATGLSGRTWTSLNRAGDVHYRPVAPIGIMRLSSSRPTQFEPLSRTAHLVAVCRDL